MDPKDYLQEHSFADEVIEKLDQTDLAKVEDEVQTIDATVAMQPAQIHVHIPSAQINKIAKKVDELSDRQTKTLKKLADAPEIGKVEITNPESIPVAKQIEVTNLADIVIPEYPESHIERLEKAVKDSVQEVQKVEITNPPEVPEFPKAMKVDNLPTGYANDAKQTNPSYFVNVRLTDGEHFYMASGGGGGTGTSVAQVDANRLRQSNDKGVVFMGVSQTNGSGMAPADGYYTPLSIDPATGALRVSGGGGGTQYTDAAAAPAHYTGNAIIYNNGGTNAGVSLTQPLPIQTVGVTTISGVVTVSGIANVQTIGVTTVSGSANSNFAKETGGNLATTTTNTTTLAGAVYQEGATAATANGVAVMWKDSSNVEHQASTANPLPVNGSVSSTQTAGQTSLYAMLFTASSQNLTIPVAGYSNITLTVSGTYNSFNGSFKASLDGGITYPITVQATRTDSYTTETSTGVITNTIRGWNITVAGVTHFQFSSTAIVSGTAVVNAIASSDDLSTAPTVGISTSANTVQSVGNAAAGAADSANPVKIGGKFNLSPPTVTDGQRSDFQASSRGSQLIANGPEQLFVTQSGTWNDIVTGNVANAATDSGNPVKVGGKYNQTITAVTNGQRVDFQGTSNGSQMVANGPEQFYTTISGTPTVNLGNTPNTTPILSRNYDQSDGIYNSSTLVTTTFSGLSVTVAGTTALVSGISNKQIRVLNIVLIASGTTNVQFKNHVGGTALTGGMPLGSNTGFAPGEARLGQFQTAVGDGLDLVNTLPIPVAGWITYIAV